MAIIDSYTTLSDAVEAYLNRSDLDSMIPNFIQGAEKLVYPVVKHRGVETAFTANTASGVLALSGLTNFREMKWMRVATTPGVFLKPLSIEAMYELYPDRSVGDSHPKFYARDAAEIIFGPSAAATVALDGVYYSRLPVLSASNTTNFFTANFPEVLLYGALTQAEPHIVGDARIPVWASLFKEHFETVQEEGKNENRTHSSRSVRIL